MIQQQDWKPPYEIVEVPQDRVKLLFPQNHFSATIIGDHVQLSISTDAAGLDAVKARIEVLIQLMRLGPMPQPAIFGRPREALAEDLGITGWGASDRDRDPGGG